MISLLPLNSSPLGYPLPKRVTDAVCEAANRRVGHNKQLQRELLAIISITQRAPPKEQLKAHKEEEKASQQMG
ncbi:hypothetical protein CEXT_33321 [Caerostris extrusa]|uniref:Uncharacterized protein n=1 Tax=Caerostris extrusa TaxID=172846 RepID=A0AAV4T5Y6_CAEEX|nr:hypothetical protein CEXT_33321 [Caerostris extrusa]